MPQAAVLFFLTFLIFTLVFSLADPLSDDGGCAHIKRDARLERLRQINALQDAAHDGESLPLALLGGDCSVRRVSFDSDGLSGQENVTGRKEEKGTTLQERGREESRPHAKMHMRASRSSCQLQKSAPASDRATEMSQKQSSCLRREKREKKLQDSHQ